LFLDEKGMKFIIAKKIGMSQIFRADGTVVPVTKVVAGPCVVIDKKDATRDGYTSVKCAFDQANKIPKPLLGILKKLGLGNYRVIREFRLDATDKVYQELQPGDTISAEIFQAGDEVTVTGWSKGKGFQGVVKRHGFSGGKKSHGHKDQHRMPGSSGATGPQHVFKGARRSGHMGTDQITIAGLEVIEVEAADDILYLKGAVPGARNGLLLIRAEGDFSPKRESTPEAAAVVSEAPVEAEVVLAEVAVEQPIAEAADQVEKQ
jgi:large subunit ribosomal protein L3